METLGFEEYQEPLKIHVQKTIKAEVGSGLILFEVLVALLVSLHHCSLVSAPVQPIIATLPTNTAT
jgi:hypothetical protein